MAEKSARLRGSVKSLTFRPISLYTGNTASASSSAAPSVAASSAPVQDRIFCHGGGVDLLNMLARVAFGRFALTAELLGNLRPCVAAALFQDVDFNAALAGGEAVTPATPARWHQ